MKICVRSLSGHPYHYAMDSNSTVLDLKSRVSSDIGMELEKTIILFNQAELEDTQILSELDLAPESFFIACRNTPVVKAAKSDLPDEPVCPTDQYGSPIPLNLDALINYLVGLKYTHEQALAALEFTKYDLRNATNLLIYGQGFEDPAEKNTAKTLITDNVTQLALTVKRTNGEDQLTPKDKLAIDRLMRKHKDRDTVIRVFLACNKDELATVTCLQTVV